MDYIFGLADVVVCDGFVGNIVLESWRRTCRCSDEDA